jgi:hypothetical protein
MNIPASGGCAILNRDVFLHTISTFLLPRLGQPAQPMLPILPILPKKVMLFATMLSNSIKNASNPPDLPFSPPQAIHEPQTRPHRRAHRVGVGSSEYRSLRISPPLFATDGTMPHLRRSGTRLRLRGFP